MPMQGGGYNVGRRVPTKKSPSPTRVAVPRPEVAVQSPRSAAPRGPQRAQTVFSTRIGSVHPAGGSAAQRTARVNTRNESYRSQIVSTRQIIKRQQPQLPNGLNPRQELYAAQKAQAKQQSADRRAAQIAAHQVATLQSRTPNPRIANETPFRIAYQNLRRVSDIGRLTKAAADKSNPLQHRVGALRALRSRYGIPVTQENFKQFRQAQAFHDFLHNGKEGQTFTIPTNQHGPGLHRTSETYQLRKDGRDLVPVPVHGEPHLSLSGALSGHPYKQGLVRDISAQQAIAAQSGGIAQGFAHAGIDTAHFGAKLIPEGKVGTPLRKGIAEIAAMGPNTITGLYGLGAAGVAAATGNTKPISDIAKSFSNDDPVGRLLTHGDLKGFAAHPGIAVAEVLGGLKAADNIAGRVERGGGFRRPNPPDIRSVRTAPFTRLSRQERYSKGYVTSRVQRRNDARTVATFNKLRGEARDLAVQAKVARDAGRGDEASGLLKEAQDKADQAERYNPKRVRGEYQTEGPHRAMTGDLERHADIAEGTNQTAQRSGRAEVETQLLGHHAVRESKRRPGVVLKDAQAEVQGLIAEGRVAPHRGELEKLAKRLEGQEQFLSDHHEIATNRSVVGAIREVLKTHSDDQLRLLGDEANRYAGVNRKLHGEAYDVGALDPAEAEMSAAKPFAVEQMGARPDAQGILRLPKAAPEEVGQAIRNAEHTAAAARTLRSQGSKVDRSRLAHAEQEAEAAQAHLDEVAPRLRLEQIHSAMNAYADEFPGAMRPGEQAFISHSSRIRGSGSFNMRAETAKGLSTVRRSGAAVVHGTASVGREAMIASATKIRNTVTQIKSFRTMIRNAAARDLERVDHVNGHVGIIQENSADEALAKYNHQGTDQETGLPIPGFVPGVAVRINPFGGRAVQMTHTLDEVDAEGFLPGNEHPVQSTIEDALQGKDVGSGPWTVLPKPYVDRLIEHSRVNAGGSPFFRALTNAFRHTVLPFSPTWLAGNAIESVGRAAVAGWHPGDSDLENRAIDQWSRLSPQESQRFVLGIGRGHLGSVNRVAVRATANSLSPGLTRSIRQVADKMLEHEKAGKPLAWGAEMISAYTRWMLDSVNGTMEDAIKRGMVGTQMRHLLPADLPAKSEAAARYIAGELHSNPAAVEELLHSVQRAYGVYEHQTPAVRRLVTSYVPFGAWMINASNFLFHVLPADHPGLVALAAASNSATQQYRRENGLDATLAGEKDAGQRPPFLQGSIPTPAWYARLVGADPGAPLRLARYTPAGIMTDPTSSIASAFLPQLPLNALQGFDFAGRQLRNKDGSAFDDSQKVGYFVSQLVLGTVPIVGQIVRVGKKGPGALNPFQPVASGAKASSGSGNSWLPSSGSSGSDWSPSASGGGSSNSWMP